MSAYFAFFHQGWLLAVLLVHVTRAVGRESFITRVFGAGGSCCTSISVGTGMSLCVTVTGGGPAVGTKISPEEIPGSCPVLDTSCGSWKGLTAILTFTGWNQ